MRPATASKRRRAIAPTATVEGQKRRLVLVEDQPIVRQGLAQLINQQPGLRVAGEADTASKALDLIRASPPDLVLLEVALPTMNGLELIKQLKSEQPHLPMLVISMHDEMLYAERALRAGARGYVMKKEPGETMLLAIARVLQGEIYVSERMQQKMLRQLVGHRAPNVSHASLDHFSDRELEVFQLLGHGIATRQIATRLCLSIKTIDSYRENLKLKLNVNSGAELVHHAVQWMKSAPAL